LNKPANSFEAVKFVLDYAPKDLTAMQRLVLIQIAHHYPKPHLSQKTLAKEIGVKRVDTVNKAVKVLSDRGLLRVLRQGQMKANKYELNYGSSVYAETGILNYGETGIVNYGQTGIQVYGETVNKQTNIKQYNKEQFLLFLESFPGFTSDQGKVYRAWQRALLKDASAELLIAASRANKENLQPDAWLNFEKWKGFVDPDVELNKLREMSI
jgi:hypothetical protein